jgi:hypothetical protein
MTQVYLSTNISYFAVTHCCPSPYVHYLYENILANCFV